MTTEITNNSLNILEPVYYDNSIESLQYSDYTPQSQANLNHRGTPIKIEVNATDEYLNTSKSYLIIKGQLVRANNNTAYAVNDDVALINNAMMYLFSEISYSINGQIVEKLSTPGQITSMLGYLSQPDDYSTSAGLKSCWSKDTTDHANSTKFVASVAVPAQGIAAGLLTPAENPDYNQGFAARKSFLMSANPRGSFSFVIPFDHMFGFGDYNKVIYNVKHSLTLTRYSSDNEAIYHANGVEDGKINLTNITWKIPHVKVETIKLMELRDIIDKKQVIPVAFSARSSDSTTVSRSRTFTWRTSVINGVEKPRWIIIGFQTDRNATQEQNPAIFNHLNLSNAYVTLNSEKYPIIDIITNFPTNDYSMLYEMFDNFKKDYYGLNSLVGGTQVNYPAFKSLFPIIVFDVRHQNEKLKSGVIDMQLKCNFNNEVPANTTAYCLIISDRLYQLKSDGKNLTMITS